MEDVPKQHQLKIARSTLRMTDEGATIMGGMTKTEARRALRENSASMAQFRRTIGQLEGNLDHIDD